ncbi:MAG: hypothetical protein J5658_10990 [Prevotella sp.]|nr:hypothetical protein [Prevotella sp.]
MIKSNLKVCATINRAASVKKDKKGASYLSYGVQLPVSGKNGESQTLVINVMMAPSKGSVSDLTVGRRVALEGEMAIHKHGGKLSCYLRPERVELVENGSDSIEGTLEFRGKLGKKDVELKEDKNGNIYMVFSAFSTDKTKDKPEFTWVSFLYFDPKDGEDFLKPGTYIDAKGTLQLGVYHDAVTLDCLVDEVKPWILNKQ